VKVITTFTVLGMLILRHGGGKWVWTHSLTVSKELFSKEVDWLRWTNIVVPYESSCLCSTNLIFVHSLLVIIHFNLKYKEHL